MTSYVKNIEDDNWTKSYLWYDARARAVGTYSINHLGGYTKTETSLDFAGVPQLSKVYHKRLGTDAEKTITRTFEYDSGNRLKKQWHQVDSQPQELLSENTYNDLSQLILKKTGNSQQEINYAYNIRGGVTGVNDPDNLGNDLFAYAVSYYQPSGTAAGKYSGNIESVRWKSAQDNILRKYTYEYDALNRLTKGLYAELGSTVPGNNFYNESAAYDPGGNLLSLQRHAKSASATAEMIDNLVYTYTGNRLASVKDNSQNYAGYPDVSGNPISYDDNGNMTDHTDKGILEIKYNLLNQPDFVKFDKTYVPRTNLGGDYNVNTQYLYRADGSKLRKTYTFGFGPTNTQTATQTDYLDGFQYEATSRTGKFSMVLKFVPTAEGYYDFEKNKYIYSYTDHLGNVRLSYFKNTGGSAEVLEENNFYPFGLKHEGYNAQAGNPSYNYQYNGKELQKETGWSDYGARMYMADIGRWGVVDPLAETGRRFTPYNYAYDNPVSFIDPDGRKPMASTEMDENSVGFVNGRGMLSYLGRGDSQSIMSFLGRDDEFMKSRVDGLGGGGGSAATFGDTQIYKDIMAYLAESASFEPDFSKFDFSQFGNLVDNSLSQTQKKSIANVYVETDGVGHVFVEVDGTVYSYGRYDGSYSPASGSLAPLGDGILLKLEGKNATNFIAERNSKYKTDKYSLEVDATKVKAYYNKLYDSGTPLKGKDGYNKYGRAIDVYNLIGPGGNNCTTITYKALNYGGANIRPAQTPAGMRYDFQQLKYYNQGYNPSQHLWGPK